MISIGFVALAVTALVVVLAGSGARRRGEGCGMRRFWTAVLMIGVVFALNVTLRFPHTARHHRTLLPPKPPAAPAPPVIGVWNDDNAPVKVAVGPKITWTRGRVAK